MYMQVLQFGKLYNTLLKTEIQCIECEIQQLCCEIE